MCIRDSRRAVTDLLRRLKADVLDEGEDSHAPQAVVQEPVHVLPLLLPPLPERTEARARNVETVRNDVAASIFVVYVVV